MRKFQSLNQAPLFKIGKRSLTGETYSFIESRKHDSIFGKALYPANIVIAQNDEPPRSLRRKSASTIIAHNCSSVVFGSQPSFCFAFSGLPISSSTSAGR